MHPIEIRRLEKHKVGLGRLLLEMAMIVFGILLALNLESYKERRHERELAKTALHNIRREIEQNKKNIEAVMPLQKEKLKDYAHQHTLARENMKAADGTKKEVLPLAVVLYPAGLLQTAWDTANITKALALTDYNLIQELAEIYLMQKLMVTFEDKFLQAFINPASFQNENRIWFIAIQATIIKEYLAIENQLLKSYGAILPKLGDN